VCHVCCPPIAHAVLCTLLRVPCVAALIACTMCRGPHCTYHVSQPSSHALCVAPVACEVLVLYTEPSVATAPSQLRPAQAHKMAITK